ncbi:MAG TPA: hypothetical protein VGO53_07435, partial [Steroidobacteraceae bacterium]|nr:hypothetical protein [Steroidobacteraceae bacterium]
MHQNTITEFIVVGPADVFRILTMASCIEGMEHVMRRVSQGKTQLPLRNVISLPGGGGNFFAAMPGCIDEPVAVGAKLAAIFPRNAERGLSSHNGV